MFLIFFTWGRKVESGLDWCRNNGVINFHENIFTPSGRFFTTGQPKRDPKRGRISHILVFYTRGRKQCFTTRRNMKILKQSLQKGRRCRKPFYTVRIFTPFTSFFTPVTNADIHHSVTGFLQQFSTPFRFLHRPIFP